MLQNVFQRLRILSLSDSSIGFEDVLHGGMHIGLKGQLYKLILCDSMLTASFSKLKLQVIFLLVALVRYS